MKKDVRIDLIVVDAGTQQRTWDEETIFRYLSLLQDGIEFPPVEIISDNVNFWLWDGFHRLECARRQGQKTISAHVEQGTLRDAIWLSFGANKDHGLPRQKGAAKKIISLIFNDSSWSKKSLSEIARHTGTTRQYVTKVRDELTQVHDKTGDSEPKTAQGATRLHPSRADEIEVQTKDGIPYTQKSQERRHKPDEPPKDSVGRTIPEHLRDTYASRSLIWQYVNDLARLRDGVIKHIENQDPVFSLLNLTAFQADYENLKRTLKSSLPHAVCVYCGGDSKSCEACQGFGLTNKNTYDAAPKELKP